MEYTIPQDCPYDNPALFYAGEDGYYMSNFSAFMVEWQGKLWPTSEHAFQASKFFDRQIQEEIRSARSPRETKQLANHKYPQLIRSDWKVGNVSIMKSIVRAKLQQHDYIQRKLLETGDRPLVENSAKDAFWGRGADWQGRNELGKIWMKLRDELRRNGHV